MAEPQGVTPLTDDEILAVANDPELVKKFTSDERRRLSKLKPETAQPLVRSRTGQLYQPPTDSGISEALQGVASAFNPRTYLDFADRAISNPMGTAGDVLMSPLRILGGLVTSPMQTTGQLMGGALLGGAVNAARGAIPASGIAEPINAAGRVIERAGAARNGIGGLAVEGAGKAMQMVRPSMPAGFDRYLPNEGATASAPPSAPSAPVAPAPPAVGPSAPAPSALAGLSGGLTDEEVQAVERLAAEGKYSRDQILAELQRQKAQGPPTPKPKLTAAEVSEARRLIQRGQATDLQDALAKMAAAKELAARMGLQTPTVAETKFPKGMRDYGAKNPIE